MFYIYIYKVLTGGLTIQDRFGFLLLKFYKSLENLPLFQTPTTPSLSADEQGQRLGRGPVLGLATSARVSSRLSDAAEIYVAV